MLSPGGGGGGGDGVGAPPIGGFSIGLSPLSPGFALVPRHHHRRESAGVDAGDAGGHGDASGDGATMGIQEAGEEEEQGRRATPAYKRWFGVKRLLGWTGRHGSST